MKARTLACISTAILAMGGTCAAGDTLARAMAKLPAPITDTMAKRDQKPVELVPACPKESVSSVTYRNHLITVDLSGGYGWKVELKNMKSGKTRSEEFGRQPKTINRMLTQPLRFFVLDAEGGPEVIIMPRDYLPMFRQFLAINFNDAENPVVKPCLMPTWVLGRVTNAPLATLEKDGKMYFFIWSATFSSRRIATVSEYDGKSAAASLAGCYEGAVIGLFDEMYGDLVGGKQQKTITLGDSGFTVRWENQERSFRFNSCSGPLGPSDSGM